MDHYVKAEKLLREATTHPSGRARRPAIPEVLEALTHAMLAVADRIDTLRV